MQTNLFKRARRTALIALGLFVSAPSGAETNGSPVRLAIISESAASAAVADLLTVELSGKPRLQLLERAEIEKVYREQGLSAANRDFLKLAQILGADGLLLLTPVSEGTNQFMQARLVAVKPGVVIEAVRSAWPVEDSTRWARWLANHFDPLFPKLGVLAKDALPISVVNLRAAVKSAEEQETEQQLTLLAIERLTRERELFVLERRRMELLSGEKELKGMDESAFWNGSYLLDGVIDRDGYSKETVTIHARLSPPKGGAPVPIEISGSRTNLAVVINQLVGKVMQGLKLASRSAPWSPADEAEKYFEEAKWAFRWKMLKEAQAACESSWALGKQTKEVAELRIRIYGEEGRPFIGDWLSPHPTSPAFAPDINRLAPAIHALELYQQGFKTFLVGEMKADTNWYRLAFELLGSQLLRQFYYFPGARQGREEQLAHLRLLSRETIAMLESHPAYKAISPDLAAAQLGTYWYETQEESVEAYRKIAYSRFSHGLRKSFFYHNFVGWKSDDKEKAQALWHKLVEELCASTNALTKVDGYCLALAEVKSGPDREEKTQQLYRAVIENALALDLAGLTDGLIQDIRHLAGDDDRCWRFQVEFHEAIKAAKSRIKVEAIKAYLQARTPYEDSQFNKLIFNNPFSESEARELLPLIKEYRTGMAEGRIHRAYTNASYWRNPTNGGVSVFPDATNRVPSAVTSMEKRFEEKIAAKPVASGQRSEPVKPITVPAAKPVLSNVVQVTRFWALPPGWILEEWGASPDISITGSRFREGRFWLEVFNGYNGLDLHKAFIFGVDLKTFQTEVIDLRLNKTILDLGNKQVELFSTGNSFEVIGEFVYFNGGGRIQRYSLRTKSWEDLAVPVEGRNCFSLLGGRLFVTTDDSIMEVAQNGKGGQILASTRRRPALNILDSFDGYSKNSGLGYSMARSGLIFPPIFQGPNQSLRTMIQRKIYTQDASKNEWSETIALPVAENGTTYAAFDAGTVFRCCSRDLETSWLLLLKDQSSLELALTELDVYLFLAQPIRKTVNSAS